MPSTDGDRARIPTWYWVFVGAFIGFGFISILTIGGAFLLVGGTLAALAPFRRSARVFWPILAIVIGFIVGYAAVVPWGCSQSGSATNTGGVVETSTSPVECTSLAGVKYSGPDGYNPPLTPGLVSGLVVAGLSGLVVFTAVSVAEARNDRDASEST